MTFHVGQKVVCVDAKPRHIRLLGLSMHRIYTIRNVGPELDDPGVFWVLLEEVHNSKRNIDGNEYGYDARRFRPLVSRKTDISIFTQMLNPSKQEVE